MNRLGNSDVRPDHLCLSHLYFGGLFLCLYCERTAGDNDRKGGKEKVDDMQQRAQINIKLNRLSKLVIADKNDTHSF